jgi:hypothetical protein
MIQFPGDLVLEDEREMVWKKFQRTGLNRHCKLLMLSYAIEQWGNGMSGIQGMSRLIM